MEVEAVDGVLEGVCLAETFWAAHVAQLLIDWRRRCVLEQQDEVVVFDAVEETLSVAVIRFCLTYFIWLRRFYLHFFAADSLFFAFQRKARTLQADNPSNLCRGSLPVNKMRGRKGVKELISKSSQNTRSFKTQQTPKSLKIDSNLTKRFRRILKAPPNCL